ncbi:MAG: PHP domain-containing protein, partial [Caldilineaceae bacterium]
MKNENLPITNNQYTELHCHSYYSLLDGASSPEALVARAADLGLPALALTDHDSLAGAVRFWTAARAAGIQPIFGAELTLADGHHLTVLAETQDGYANLCRLLTQSRLEQIPEADYTQTPGAWPGKVTPALDWEMLHAQRQGLIVLSGCRRGPVLGPLVQGQEAIAQANVARLCECFAPEQLFLEVQHHALPNDDQL